MCEHCSECENCYYNDVCTPPKEEKKELEMEKHSYGAMIVFKEQLRVRHMGKKEAKEYAQAKGVEAKGARMLEELGMLALVEAYDKLCEEHQKCKKQ